MSDDILDAFDLAQLETLRDKYAARHDSANVAAVRAAIGRKGAVQTDELANSGKLFAHRERDDAGRVITRYVGDCNAWMTHFTTNPIICRINAEQFKDKN